MISMANANTHWMSHIHIVYKMIGGSFIAFALQSLEFILLSLTCEKKKWLVTYSNGGNLQCVPALALTPQPRHSAQAATIINIHVSIYFNPCVYIANAKCGTYEFSSGPLIYVLFISRSLRAAVVQCKCNVPSSVEMAEKSMCQNFILFVSFSVNIFSACSSSSSSSELITTEEIFRILFLFRFLLFCSTNWMSYK